MQVCRDSTAAARKSAEAACHHAKQLQVELRTCKAAAALAAEQAVEAAAADKQQEIAALSAKHAERVRHSSRLRSFQVPVDAKHRTPADTNLAALLQWWHLDRWQS